MLSSFKESNDKSGPRNISSEHIVVFCLKKKNSLLESPLSQPYVDKNKRQ